MEITSYPLSLLPSLPRQSHSHSFFSFNPRHTFLKPNNPTSLTLNYRTRSSRMTHLGKKRLSCNCLFGLGVPELVVIAGVAALVFGPKNLPEVGKSIGKTVKSFQQAAKEFESELKKDPETPSDAIDTKPVSATQQEKEDVKVATSKET